MTKKEFIKAVANESGLSVASATKAVNALTDVITGELAAGGIIQMIGFGTFDTTKRIERNGVNPQTGEKMTIPAKRVPRFRAGTTLKSIVKNG